MFKKEAKVYAERTKTEKELKVLNTVRDWGIESLDPDERRLFAGIQDREKAREQGFKDGAEYVYNKLNVQLNKAKELIQYLIDSLEVIDGEQIRELKVVKEAEQFLINIERYENGK